MPTELKPGEWLNLVVRIEKKGWALMKEQTQKPGEKARPRPIKLDDLSSTPIPFEKAKSVLLEKGASFLVPEALSRYQSVEAKEQADKEKAELLDLSGVYFTPVFIRAQYEYSWLPVEHCLKAEWRLNRPEMVSLSMNVVGTDPKERGADLCLSMRNNTEKKIELALKLLDGGVGMGKSALAFEATEFAVGKLDPQQSKDVHLHARLMEPRADEGVNVWMRDNVTGAEEQFVLRVHIA